MRDFQLTESGDLMFTENSNTDNGLVISFHVSENKGFRLTFMVAESDFISPNNIDESLCISFDTVKLLNNKEIIVLDDEGGTNQAIKIRLATELGDIKNREGIGSKLSLVKHKNLYDSKNIQLVKEYVQSAISDIAPNASVAVTPHNMTYNIKITLENNVFNYTLKG